MTTQETKAMRFESFLKRAYKLDRRTRRPSKGEYYTLTRAKEKGNYQKELKAVKERIAQVIEIFFKQELNNETQEGLKRLASLNAQAKDSNDVSAIIENGLSLTEQFK